MNTANTASTRAKKGTVSVIALQGQVKACFPRSIFQGSKQIKLSTGIELADGWQVKAAKLQARLQSDLEIGKFDDGQGNFDISRYNEILSDFGLRHRSRLKVPTDNQSPNQVIEPNLMEVWKVYMEYKKPSVAISTYKVAYEIKYTGFLKAAIKAIGNENAVAIRNWLLENRATKDVKSTLSQVSHAYKFAIQCGAVSHNPYEGMSETIGIKRKDKAISQHDKLDDAITDTSKAYTWDEILMILDYVGETESIAHYYDFLMFRALTGCRTGEAIAFWWCDVKWDKECIIIRRNYSRECKQFKSTKNGTERLFPMTRDGKLWQLLEAQERRGDNDIVFPSKQGKIISLQTISNIWAGSNHKGIPGIIPTLIKQGKLTKALPLYNIRHSAITHWIYDLQIPEVIVNAWCEHSEAISRKHYQDTVTRAMQYSPDEWLDKPRSQDASKTTQTPEERIAELERQIAELLKDKT